MGLILGRFRKKKTTLEQLEKLDADIKSIEAFRLNTELAQRRIVGQFILVSAGIYIVVAVVFYFHFFPATFYDQIFYITPLLLVPFIIWGVKRLLTWYYRRKINRNESKLLSLRVEKKKLLDHVMDTETYKVAKSILEKFAHEQVKKSPVSFEVTPYKQPTTNIASHSSFTNRARTSVTGGTAAFTEAPKTPITKAMPSARVLSTPANEPISTNNQPATAKSALVRQPQPLQLPREILPRDRSVLDKMVEYLVGDGPGNRFALICKSCYGHNGMALPEEFEYFAFRCCYCHTFNPARKLRPQAPKLDFELPTPGNRRRASTHSTSSSEKNSSSDSDSDEKTPTVNHQNPPTDHVPMEVDHTEKSEEEKKSD